MDYIKILTQVDPRYHGMTRDELLAQFNSEDNTHAVVNEIKDFLFQKGFYIAPSMILYYLLSYYKPEDEFIPPLLFKEERTASLEKKPFYSPNDLCIERHDYEHVYWVSSTTIHILKKLNYPITPSVYDVYLELAFLIWERLSGVLDLDLNGMKDTDLSMIKSNFNNFFLRTNSTLPLLEPVTEYIFRRADHDIDLKMNTVANKIRENIYGHSIQWQTIRPIYEKDPKLSPSKEIPSRPWDKEIVGLTEVSKVFKLTKEMKINVLQSAIAHIDFDDDVRLQESPLDEPKINQVCINVFENGVVCYNFALPYSIKQFKVISLKDDNLILLLKKLSRDQFISIFNQAMIYKRMILETTKKFPSPKYSDFQLYNYNFSSEQMKMTLFYYEPIKAPYSNNFDLAYTILQNYSLTLESPFFAYADFESLDSKVCEEVNNPDNKAFVLLKLKRGTCQTKFSHVFTTLFASLPEDKKIERVALFILLEFYLMIEKTTAVKMLTNSPYSPLLFKLYLDALFRPLYQNQRTFLCFNEEFLIFGKRDEIESRVKSVTDILKLRFALDGLEVYDKLLNSSMNVFYKDYSFNQEEEADLYEETKTDNSYTLEVKLSLSSKNPDISPLFLTILSPEQLVLLFKENMTKEIFDVNMKTQYESQMNTMCGICQETDFDTVIIPCGHAFCEACLERLSNKVCPYCRVKMNKTCKIYPPC